MRNRDVRETPREESVAVSVKVGSCLASFVENDETNVNRERFHGIYTEIAAHLGREAGKNCCEYPQLENTIIRCDSIPRQF